MNKLVTTIVFINLTLNMIAQTEIHSPALILPKEEKTILKINGITTELKTSLLCEHAMQIQLLKGSVILLNQDGTETTYKAGYEINIIEKVYLKNSFPVKKLSQLINKPSLYLPNLYNSDRNEPQIYPIQSSIIDEKNLKFFYSEEFHTNVTFKLFLKEKDLLIWEVADLQKINGVKKGILTPGQKYYWKIYNGSNSLKGELILLKKNQVKKLKLKEYKTKEDYIVNFLILMENECRFDAVAVILEARSRFPDSYIIKSVCDKFLFLN